VPDPAPVVAYGLIPSGAQGGRLPKLLVEVVQMSALLPVAVDSR
jgi:hypothetical protein